MKFKLPHSYALIVLIILLVTLMTYFVPAGEYERVSTQKGIERVKPDSFHLINNSPVSFFEFFKSIYEGMVSSADIIFFVFIIGGVFNIIKNTGIINQGINLLIDYFEGKEKLIIPIIVFIFSLAGAVLGVSEEILPFYPLLISVSILMGFDKVVGISMGLLGVTSGFAAGFFNPFTVAIAQDIAQLPLFSGFILRIIVYIIFVGSTILYLMRYAGKISNDPKLSITYEEKDQIDYELDKPNKFNQKHIRVIIVIIVGYLYLLYGIIEKNYYISEITAIFLIMGIIVGIVYEMNINDIAVKFVDGAGNLVNGALIIGFARAITLVMEKGNILDTIIYSMVSIIKTASPIFNGILMFIVQLILGVFIPSGSGQAAATMPIMVPISDLLGIPRQTAVLAYQFGDGFVNAISPTSGFFMAALALSGIAWKKWARWMFPLFSIWCLEAVVIIFVSMLIGYGPF